MPFETTHPWHPSKASNFAATRENTDRMHRWLLERYAASTFNTCPNQALPTMIGPPMSISMIRVVPDAEPVMTSRPAKVPVYHVYWRDEVNRQLQQDVALGVIEKVPPGMSVTWLHNMVITPKANGSPRRPVDLQALNKVSVREAHPLLHQHSRLEASHVTRS